jgi:hypothetical protein
MLAIAETRKSSLASQFGENKCVTDESWMAATLAELTQGFYTLPEDIDFLYNTPGYCSSGEEPTGTGIIIDTGGLNANVYINGNLMGKTDDKIDIKAGTYSATLKKTGYNDTTVTVTSIDGVYTTSKATMTVKSQETGNIDVIDTTTNTTGAILKLTGGLKGNIAPGSKIQLGITNWFGVEHVNQGTGNWRGYIGVRLSDEGGNKFAYGGDPTYVSKIAPGETKYLWAKTVVPTNINIGKITVTLLRTSV